MQRHVAYHHVGAPPVRPVVLGEQAGVRLHVVVEEEDQLPLGARDASIASGCAAPVVLLDHR